MCDQYKKISRFEVLVNDAISTCKAQKVVHNLHLRHAFPAALISRPFDGACEKQAKQWQEPRTPRNLHINHGHFIHAKGNGILHIIRELKRKNDSNRALYSLISTPDIVGKGDLPIPSFMILQFGLLDRVLYCTAYFRALEVSRFLPINVTEMCIVMRQIWQALPQIKNVRLCVHAFRAYHNPEMDCLEKSLMDLEKEGAISGYLAARNKKDKIKACLHSKLRESTVIETSRLDEMCNFLRLTRATTRDRYSDPFLLELEHARQCLIDLKSLRKTASYSTQIQQRTKEFKDQ